jgi:hypothetical protein
MRHLILATTLFVTPAAAFAASGSSCAVAPSPQEAAALNGQPQSQPQPSVPLPSPINPQALAAKYTPKPSSPASSAGAAVLSQTFWAEMRHPWK